MLAALASSPATKALDPDPFPRHSLRHAVYAALLHFGFETAMIKMGVVFMITTSTVAIYTGIARRWLAVFGYMLSLLILFGSY